MGQLLAQLGIGGPSAPPGGGGVPAPTGSPLPQMQVQAPQPNFNISDQPVRGNMQGYSIAPEGVASMGIPPATPGGELQTSVDYNPPMQAAQAQGDMGTDPRMAILQQLMNPEQPSFLQKMLVSAGDALQQSQAGYIPVHGPSGYELMQQNYQNQNQQRLQAMLLASKLGVFPGPNQALDSEVKQSLIDQRKASAELSKARTAAVGKGGSTKTLVHEVQSTPELAAQFGYSEGTPLKLYTDADGKPKAAYPAVPKAQMPNAHFIDNKDGTIDVVNPKTNELIGTRKTSTKLGGAASTRVVKAATDHASLVNSYDSIDRVLAKTTLNDTMLNMLRTSPKLLQLEDLMGAARTPEEREFVAKFTLLQANLRGLFTNEVGNLNEDEAERAMAPLRTLNMDQLKVNLRTRINNLARGQKIEYSTAKKVGAEKGVPKLYYLNRDGKKTVKDPDSEPDTTKVPASMGSLGGSAGTPSPTEEDPEAAVRQRLGLQ